MRIDGHEIPSSKVRFGTTGTSESGMDGCKEIWNRQMIYNSRREQFEVMDCQTPLSLFGTNRQLDSFELIGTNDWT